MSSSFAWYIVQAHSGFEKKVAASITENAERDGISEFFDEVIVPVEEVVELKKGKKVSKEKKFFPGYVLVKMKMDEKAWLLVSALPKVTGFLGGKGKPQPISEAEASRILTQVQEGIDQPKHFVSYDIGQIVRINDGPFETFSGAVEEVDNEKGKLKVSVVIFGRSTPVELEFSQVEAE